MQKIVMMISLFITILLITGCASIPIGDGGKLEVSKEGMNIETVEEELLEDPEEVVEPEVIEDEEIDVVAENDDIDITDEDSKNQKEKKLNLLYLKMIRVIVGNL